MKFYEAARACGDAVLRQVKDVMDGGGDDVNLNAIKVGIEKFRAFPSIKAKLQDWLENEAEIDD